MIDPKDLAEALFGARNALPVAVLLTARDLIWLKGQHNGGQTHTVFGIPVYPVVGLVRSAVLYSDGTTTRL